MIKILIVDDEKSICDLIDINLSAAGYHCKTVQDGLEAIDMIEAEDFDLILLDIMLPGADGFEVLRYIQENRKKTAAIMLTALEDEQTQVKAFNLYADDYVIKPVSPIILLKRMETILRRTAGSGAERGRGLVLREEAYCAYYRGEKLPLTLSEYLLLHTLMSQPNRVFTREQLILSIFNEDYIGNDRIIDAHVKNLRKKLPVPCIRTVIGVGYQFDKAAEQNAAEGH